MIIYDEVKKNNKIAVFNNYDDILDNVINILENEEYNYEIYDDLEKLKNKIIKGKIRIVVVLKLDYELIETLTKTYSLNVIVLKTDEDINYKKLKKLNIQNITPLEGLTYELYIGIRVIAQAGKIDYQKFKLDIVSNLVESISHKIQANLLTIGASQDVIKMVSEDSNISKNKEKSKIIDDLYLRNDIALQKSNTLLQLMSDATSISSETIMKGEDIFDIINIVLDEYLKENVVQLNYDIKLKSNAYICGPLNDVIFIICKIIKEMIAYNEKNISIKTYEDEGKWYFEVYCKESIENREIMHELYRYLLYVNNTGGKIKGNMFHIYIKKLKE